MNAPDWIAYIDRLRTADGSLADGEWHGYLNDGPPLSGRYCLVRWAEPTAAVSHDDPTKAIHLAATLEAAIALYPNPEGTP